MPKSPDKPRGQQYRDPAKHSKKDPAKPTRAKAARPDAAPIDPSLADLLNPAIGRGRAGVGSQTGLDEKKQKRAARAAPSIPSSLVGEGREGGREVAHRGSTSSQPPSTPERHLPTLTPGPSPQGGGEEQAAGEESAPGQDEKQTSKLGPPPDNSWDRRADFANAHRARASVARGFGEAPQQGYVGKTPAKTPATTPATTPAKTPVPPGELDPDLARALGIDEQEEDSDSDAQRGVITPDMGPARLRLRPRSEIGTVAGLASQQSLDRLLREGRPEFLELPWTPHRPPRPEKSEGGLRLVIKADFEPQGDQPQAIAELVEGVQRHDRTQVLLGVTGSGIPSEIREKIYDPFFTTKGVGEGTGLGLDIVRRVIQKHRADIRLESKPGDTRFQVRLPLSRPR